MKKLITILIMCFCCSVFGAKAQVDSLKTSKDSLKVAVEPPTVKLDSITMAYIDAMYNRIIESTPRYKMYKNGKYIQSPEIRYCDRASMAGSISFGKYRFNDSCR